MCIDIPGEYELLVQLICPGPPAAQDFPPRFAIIRMNKQAVRYPALNLQTMWRHAYLIKYRICRAYYDKRAIFALQKSADNNLFTAYKVIYQIDMLLN